MVQAPTSSALARQPNQLTRPLQHSQSPLWHTPVQEQRVFRDVGRRRPRALRAAAPTVLTGSESSISEDGALTESASTSDPLQLEEYDAANTVYGLQPEDWSHAALSVVVVGASGDLARKKIYPSLFALYYEGHLPEHFHIYGYARSKMSDSEFREYISGSLTCRLSAKEECGGKMDLFLQRCLYHAGQYAEKSDFAALSERMAGTEKDRQHANRIFYLSIPPSIFTDVAACASEAASSASGWNRVIVEKPFGRDLASFQELSTELSKSLSEDQMFRIDHYLGKELIENLTARHAGHAAGHGAESASQRAGDTQ